MSNAEEKVLKSAMTVALVDESLKMDYCKFNMFLHSEYLYAPEVPFREATDERSELIVLLRWQTGNGGLAAFLDLVRLQVGLERRVEFGLEKSQEEVQKVDSESI